MFLPDKKHKLQELVWNMWDAGHNLSIKALKEYCKSEIKPRTKQN